MLGAGLITPCYCCIFDKIELKIAGNAQKTLKGSKLTHPTEYYKTLSYTSKNHCKG